MRNKWTFDKETQLMVSATKTASGVLGSVVSLGDNARADARAIVNVSAISKATDEKYVIDIQAGDAADFSGDVKKVGTLELGKASALIGNADMGTGQYEIPFTNEVAGTVYPHVRAYLTATGTAQSITLESFLVVKA